MNYIDLIFSIVSCFFVSKLLTLNMTSLMFGNTNLIISGADPNILDCSIKTLYPGNSAINNFQNYFCNRD